ncbi:hypothetical protein [Fundidesulfovibrio terrae]|uniref:hypothetical protein n=1 Tax=Fundidesulfovibrio terrae TaxID=2922866 RepID=UPI001FAEE735|nr:hypothetical protein [Fundidesulfovibrio terrae]
MEINKPDIVSPEKNKDERFEDFLLAEYNNIASAHFNAKTQISNFFRYYLLLIALPLPVIGAFKVFGSDKYASNLGGLSLDFVHYGGVLSFCLFAVGFLVMVYIINLNVSSILYARTVNGIRHYYYELYAENLSEIQVLSDSIDRPRLSGRHSMYWICATFSIIDGFYCYLWLKLIFNCPPGALTIFMLSLFLHLFCCYIVFKNAEIRIDKSRSK